MGKDTILLVYGPTEECISLFATQSGVVKTISDGFDDIVKKGENAGYQHFQFIYNAFFSINPFPHNDTF